jgi:hypothetical protein
MAFGTLSADLFESASNRSPEPAVLFCATDDDRAGEEVGIAVPGGIEELFAEQAAYFARLQGPPDLAELAAIGARHRGRLLGPPISVDTGAAANRP